MHKRVLHPARVEEIRQKIRASLIVNKLEKHILDGDEMLPSQVTAALGLLNKIVPNLSATEHSGKDGGAMKAEVLVSFQDARTRAVPDQT